MLDLKWVRENPEAVRRALAAKGVKFDLQELLKLDSERRTSLQQVETLKADRNKANDEVAQFKKAGQHDKAQSLISSLKDSSQKISEIDKLVECISIKIDSFLYIIPNIPHESVPVAEGPKGNQVVRQWGEPKTLDRGRDQLDLGEGLGWFSMSRGSKISECKSSNT